MSGAGAERCADADAAGLGMDGMLCGKTDRARAANAAFQSSAIRGRVLRNCLPMPAEAVARCSTLPRMGELTGHEARVLGVLIEKAHTTPTQYPLTLNAVVSGCNQKNNRHPVTNLTEDQVLAALDGLRSRQLAREVMLSGSRVAKFRHTAREGLEIGTSELVVLTQLLLRGPQTPGEIRGRASRMHALESIDIVRNVLDHLMQLAPPLVERLDPAPGSRADRYAQRLCPDLHDGDEVATAAPTPAPAQMANDLDARVEQLERDVAEIRGLLASILAAEAPPPMPTAD
jgi:uncharacterized protein YceH (UPF0502 family)